jgi:hypothetical protein
MDSFGVQWLNAALDLRRSRFGFVQPLQTKTKRRLRRHPKRRQATALQKNRKNHKDP